MKYLLVFAAVMFVSCSEGGTSKRELTKACDQVHARLGDLPAHGSPDPETYAADLEKVDALLNALVRDGTLAEKCYQLPPVDKQGKERLDAFLKEHRKLLEELGRKHGENVAAEMLDFGARLSFTTFQDGEPMIFRVRVPQEDLNAVEKHFLKFGVAVE